ncbi:MAG: hypothetical protein OXI19_03965 [Gemmatimonadota bacterium]|nr:hypothetical protein [Gemmatimonadota bacterium]
MSGQGLVTAVSNNSATVTARSGFLAVDVEITVMDDRDDNDDNDDRQALTAYYKATNGPDWTNNANWLIDQPLDEWYGVSTGAKAIPFEIVTSTASLEESFGGFTSAEGRVDTLSPSDNQLAGNIPPEIGQLQNLQRLSLDHNQLTGSNLPRK